MPTTTCTSKSSPWAKSSVPFFVMFFLGGGLPLFVIRPIIYQVKILCCETAHGVCVTKRNNSNNNTQQSSSSTMYAYQTDLSIGQTTPQSLPCLFLHSLEQTKKRKCHNNKKHAGFEPRTCLVRQQPTCSPTRFLFDNLSYRYVSMRTNRRLDNNDEKTKTAAAAARRRVHGLGRYLLGREGRAR